MGLSDNGGGLLIWGGDHLPKASDGLIRRCTRLVLVGLRSESPEEKMSKKRGG